MLLYLSKWLLTMVNEIQFEIGDALLIPDVGKCVVTSIINLSTGKVIEFKELRTNRVSLRSEKLLAEEIADRGHDKYHYPVLFNVPREAYWFTVGFIARRGEIELRTTPKTHDVVMREYFDVTDDWADEDYVIYNPNEATFTDNACITFNKPSDEIYNTLYFPENSKGNTIVESSKNKCKVYNKSFIWTLLSFGFRTGFDHDIDEIKLHLGRQPLEYIKAFNRGHLELKGEQHV